MESKLIEIFNHFTKDNPGAQDMKLLEEYEEMIVAFIYYQTHRNKDAFMDVLGEMLDFAVILSQKAIVEYGENFEEIEAMFKHRVNRTHGIVKEMKVTGKSYTELRRNI